MQEVAGLLQLDAAQVGQGGALGFLDVIQQHAGRGNGQGQIIDTESLQVAGPELLAKHFARLYGIEFPGRALAQAILPGDGQGKPIFDQQFRWVQALQLRVQFLWRVEAANGEATGCQLQPGQRELAAGRRHGREEVVAPGFEQSLLGQRARGHHADHLALDQALHRRGLADLLADRGGFALPNEPAEVVVQRVVRHAGHRNGRAP